MNGSDLNNYLIATMVVCGAGAVLNLFLIKRKGLRAILLAIAFTLLGVTIGLYDLKMPMPVVFVGGASVAVLLVTEAALRLSKGRRNR